MAAPTPDPSSIRGLLRLLIEQVSELARVYVAAARQEVGEGLNHLKVGSLLVGIALAFLAVGAMVLVLLLVSAISAASGLPLWVVALIVLTLVLIVAGVLLWLAYRRFRRARLMPEKTIAAAREDLEWAQHWTKRG
ncbi:MAG: phage holin family protein [Candidatus Limnocylindria bacterium]